MDPPNCQYGVAAWTGGTTCAWGPCPSCVKPSIPACGEGTTQIWNQTACQWVSGSTNKLCEEGYTHSWSTSTCSYRKSDVKIPQPACQEPRSRGYLELFE